MNTVRNRLDYYIQNSLICNEDLSINFLKQILSGYSSLHDMNILHRDIKPKFIFLKSSPPKGFRIVIIGNYGALHNWKFPTAIK